MMAWLGRCGAIFACLIGLAACQSEPVPPLARFVDKGQYSGRWYIIANIPYFAEKDKVGSFFEVSFDGDHVSDIYLGRDGSLDAPLESFTMRGYVEPGTGNAKWRESPLWPLYFSYLILYVDPEYKTALVGYPGNQLGWILARSPQISDADYKALLDRLAAAGYDPSLFKRVQQVR